MEQFMRRCESRGLPESAISMGLGKSRHGRFVMSVEKLLKLANVRAHSGSAPFVFVRHLSDYSTSNLKRTLGDVGKV